MSQLWAVVGLGGGFPGRVHGGRDLGYLEKSTWRVCSWSTMGMWVGYVVWVLML